MKQEPLNLNNETKCKCNLKSAAGRIHSAKEQYEYSAKYTKPGNIDNVIENHNVQVIDFLQIYVTSFVKFKSNKDPGYKYCNSESTK